MKKYFKLGLVALLFAFVFIAFTANTSANAEANGSLSADLDSDGTEEVVVWEFDEDSCIVTALTINGTDVYKATKTEPLRTPYDFRVKVIDTCTKDKYKEVVVELFEDTVWFAIFRYDNGKITKYLDDDDFTGYEIISQKKKNRICTSDYLYVTNIGNIFTNISYNIKSGKAKMVKGQTFKATKQNYTTSFKSTAEMTVYKKDNCKTAKGILKKGEKFTLLKFKEDKSGRNTLVYIKTKSGVKGWINTEEFESNDEDYPFLVENAPIFG